VEGGSIMSISDLSYPVGRCRGSLVKIGWRTALGF
jgi:hypothetical protein